MCHATTTVYDCNHKYLAIHYCSFNNPLICEGEHLNMHRDRQYQDCPMCEAVYEARLRRAQQEMMQRRYEVQVELQRMTEMREKQREMELEMSGLTTEEKDMYLEIRRRKSVLFDGLRLNLEEQEKEEQEKQVEEENLRREMRTSTFSGLEEDLLEEGELRDTYMDREGSPLSEEDEEEMMDRTVSPLWSREEEVDPELERMEKRESINLPTRGREQFNINMDLDLDSDMEIDRKIQEIIARDNAGFGDEDEGRGFL